MCYEIRCLCPVCRNIDGDKVESCSEVLFGVGDSRSKSNSKKKKKKKKKVMGECRMGWRIREKMGQFACADCEREGERAVRA